MSFDGTMMRAVVYELNKDYKGGKIDRIFQTEKDELLLQLRCGPNRGHLILSASANNPRAYITKEKKKNPQTPPAFCMLLRKHLESSTIVGFEQVEMDRILKIHVKGTNELFDAVDKTLVVEIMGRHSNIILVNDEDCHVIDSIKRVNQSISRIRQILPGIEYTNKDIITKSNPLKENQEGFFKKINSTQESKIRNFFINTYMGFSPLIAREIYHRSDLNDTLVANLSQNDILSLYKAFKSIIEPLSKNVYCPNQILDGDKTIAFSCLPLKQYPIDSSKHFESVHNLLDTVYLQKDTGDRILQKSQNITRQVKNHLDRALKKQEKLELELREAKDRKLYKVYGDVLSANSWSVNRGDSEITLPNFYDDMEEISIPLDIRKDAIQNAAHFYKKYSKLKHAETTIQSQLKKTRATIHYLDDFLFNIENSQTIEDIEAIQEEFKEDFLKKAPVKKKKKKEKKKTYLIYQTPDGDQIYVGRNNRENSELTLKFAQRSDLWFHVKSGPGSHIILRTERPNPSESSMEYAANLAAYYSRQKNSANVEVDYTLKSNVRRHPSNQPGLVIYTDFKTLYVTPKKEIFKELIKK